MGSVEQCSAIPLHVLAGRVRGRGDSSWAMADQSIHQERCAFRSHDDDDELTSREAGE